MKMNKRGQFSTKQVETLLQPIKGTRVLRDGKGHSHVSQQDITAHLVRMFGFGNFDVEVTEIECLFETSEVRTSKAGKEFVGYDVAYRAMVRLTIRNEFGETVCHYENGSVGSAQNQPSRADAHDLAYKSAISLSIKRAAIALGDQFGLSLYNKGQTNALVIRTLVGNGEVTEDIQQDIPQQVSLGNDEKDPETTEIVEAVPEQKSTVTDEVRELVQSAKTSDELTAIWQKVEHTDEIRSLLSARQSQLKDGM